MIGASVRERWLDRAGVRHLAALLLSALATLATAFIVAGTDSSSVRWWLVAVPLFATLAAVVVPRSEVRYAALAIAVGWCWLTALSIGFLFLPAVVALALAVSVQSDRFS